MVSRYNSSTSFGSVADVGAGTGKLVRSIVAAGCDAIAVDPDPALFDELGLHGSTATDLPYVTRAFRSTRPNR